MEFDYQTMRTFADSWGLVFMTAVFVFVVLWTLRPGGRSVAHDAAMVPFKEDHGQEDRT